MSVGGGVRDDSVDIRPSDQVSVLLLTGKNWDQIQASLISLQTSLTASISARGWSKSPLPQVGTDSSGS